LRFCICSSIFLEGVTVTKITHFVLMAVMVIVSLFATTQVEAKEGLKKDLIVIPYDITIRGDCLYRIAQRFGIGNYFEIVRRNPRLSKNPDHIELGDTINIAVTLEVAARYGQELSKPQSAPVATASVASKPVAALPVAAAPAASTPLVETLLSTPCTISAAADTAVVIPYLKSHSSWIEGVTPSFDSTFALAHKTLPISEIVCMAFGHNTVRATVVRLKTTAVGDGIITSKVASALGFSSESQKVRIARIASRTHKATRVPRKSATPKVAHATAPRKVRPDHAVAQVATSSPGNTPGKVELSDETVANALKNWLGRHMDDERLQRIWGELRAQYGPNEDIGPLAFKHFQCSYGEKKPERCPTNLPN
jgi:hypothetical protein